MQAIQSDSKLKALLFNSVKLTHNASALEDHTTIVNNLTLLRRDLTKFCGICNRIQRKSRAVKVNKSVSSMQQ
jgi:hypothetical protein